jgi:transposase InsO family protein
VCLAFAAALRAYGAPEEVLTDNGKQFTDRFGKGGEVLFDRICRDNGIIHRLTLPRHPATTGKAERFHGSLRRGQAVLARPPPGPAGHHVLGRYRRDPPDRSRAAGQVGPLPPA